MYLKGKDTIKEKIAIQKRYYNAFRIPQGKNKLLYHYTGIKTIWKILEGDSFLARNIRFSNDSEEYKLGERLVREYVTDSIFDPILCQKFQERIRHGIQMFYMICFCKNGDLLSQWRGYAKDGVSLGMDFLEEDGTQGNCIQVFTIPDNKANQCNEDDVNNTCFVEMPYEVFYVSNNESIREIKTEQMRILKEALDSFEDVDNRTEMMLNLIPFIKDNGFEEEAEYRIIFDINNLGETEAQNRKKRAKKIEYIEKDNRKLPNIIVEVGNSAAKKEPVSKVILGAGIREKAREMKKSDEDISQIYESIKKKLEGIKCECANMKHDIYIGEGSNQEDIMSIIEECLQQNGLPIDCENGVKIWCRGHLPIREAIIGPGENKDKIKESLRHYMRNTYWLRYVVIKDSEIPLQS